MTNVTQDPTIPTWKRPERMPRPLFRRRRKVTARVLLHSSTRRMNLTNRVYLAVHVALTLLVCARLDMVPRWPWYLAWNALAIAAILLFTRLKSHGKLWEFVHDWLPAIFFTSEIGRAHV